MSALSPITGMPGIRSRQNTAPRIVFRDDPEFYLPGGKIIQSGKARDSGNTGDLDVLRSGLLMGKVTATSKYAPAIIGVATGAVAGAATSVTVSPAQSVELVRRVGATGTLRWVGPPSAAGTVATATQTYSAVNTTTGVITTNAFSAAIIAGSFICDNDGSYLPVSCVKADWGLKVTDQYGADQDTPWPLFPTGGTIDASQLLPVWPSDTSLQAWIRDQLNLWGAFILDAAY